MGNRGRELVLQQFTERHQGDDIDAILEFLAMKPLLNALDAHPGHSLGYERLIDVRDKVVRKFNEYSKRNGRS
jgi:hypothetical protein